MLYYMNGEFTKKEDMKISIEDRGYYFGDGIYEVVRVYGGELFTAKEHIDRLFESAAKIKLALPHTEQEIIDIVRELIKLNELVDGYIYLQVTRGSAPRQHQFPTPAVAANITAYAVKASRPLSQMAEGVAVKSVEDIRWLRCDIKSLNLLGNVMAKEEAHEAGFHEALLHRNGLVTEGSSTNMFGVKDGIIYTHPATNLILNGITRQVVFNICKKIGLSVVEEAFTLAEADEMDEFFLTSSLSEVMPIIKINDKVIGNGKRGLITEKIQQAFAAELPYSITDIT